MRTRSILIVCVVLAAVALGWSLRLHEPANNQATPAEERSAQAGATETQAPTPQPQPRSANIDTPVDVDDRARFNEQAREFFAQAPALPPEEARRRADAISRELARLEQAGGMSAGEIFLLRAGLIRATEPDEQRQAEQLRALKERYQTRSARVGAQSDPMFELYKVRESEIVDEVMSLQAIPDGLSREEYLRRRLQQAREQLLGEAM